MDASARTVERRSGMWEVIQILLIHIGLLILGFVFGYEFGKKER